MEDTSSTDATAMSDQHPRCRLCSGALRKTFSKKIMRKYVVAYYTCINCLSLQTEKPYWLSEAYKDHNLAMTDTGAAQRNLDNLAASYVTSKILKATNVLDAGGGDGLLCRLLRDHGINCYVKDKYAKPTYAQGFTEPDFMDPDLILGFELLEHYENPEQEFSELFSGRPRALLFSTKLFRNQGDDWWYLAPETGQHVFFFSKKSLEIVAARYQYELIAADDFVVFIRNPNSFAAATLRTLLKSWCIRVLKAAITLLPTPGVWQDHLLLKNRTDKTSAVRNSSREKSE